MPDEMKVYQMPEGDWAFADYGQITDGFKTRREAELAHQVLSLTSALEKAREEREKCYIGGFLDRTGEDMTNEQRKTLIEQARRIFRSEAHPEQEEKL